MSIFFLNEKKLFHISNSVYSYLFQLEDNNMITDLYFGDPFHEDHSSSTSIYEDENLTAAGNGKMPYRRPICLYHIQAIPGEELHFKYIGHRISAEIVPAEGSLKESYAENLSIFFRCDETDTDLITSYSIVADYPIIARRISLFQNGDQTIHVKTNAEHIAKYNGNHSVISFDVPTEDIDFTLHAGESYNSKDMVSIYRPEETL